MRVVVAAAVVLAVAVVVGTTWVVARLRTRSNDTLISEAQVVVAAVQALVAIGLAILTGMYVVATNRIVETTVADRAARERAEVEAQARRVSSWVDSTSVINETSLDMAIKLQNLSEEPIFNVSVTPHYHDGDRELIPGSPGTWSQSTVGPGTLTPVAVGTLTYAPARHGRGNYGIDLAFTDASGRRWQRRAGALALIDA